jgi:hypothetical protein
MNGEQTGFVVRQPDPDDRLLGPDLASGLAGGEPDADVGGLPAVHRAGGESPKLRIAVGNCPARGVDGKSITNAASTTGCGPRRREYVEAKERGKASATPPAATVHAEKVEKVEVQPERPRA